MRQDGTRQSRFIILAVATLPILYLLAQAGYGEDASPDSPYVQLPVKSSLDIAEAHTTLRTPGAAQETSMAVPVTGLVDQQQVRAHMRFLFDGQSTPPRQFVTYDMSILAPLQVGDTIAFMIPELGFALNGLIETREDEGEAIHWSGRWANLPGDPNHFSITQVPADHYAHAIIETAAGTYVLEAKDGIGWLQNGKDIARTLHETNDGIATQPDNGTANIGR